MQSIIRIIVVTGYLLVCTVVLSENIIYPEDSGVIDVTKAPYNAAGDGVHDDTEAIQKALNAFPNGSRIIYLPNGTYLVSKKLRWGPSDEISCNICQKRIHMQGQSKEGTIIRLQDHCPDFQSTSQRRGVLWTGNSPAQRFRNCITNLTVNTGIGNPGACGIQYNANNNGNLMHVKIISEDGGGKYGLDLAHTDEIGPCLIRDLEIVGFKTGIFISYYVNSMTFEHIVLKDQIDYGLQNFGQVVNINGLISENSVPVINNHDGVLTLINGSLNGVDADAEIAAIQNNATLFARDVLTSGYGKSIENKKGSGIDHNDAYISEFVSDKIYSSFESPQKSLNLPINDPPEVPWDPFEEWANVVAFGAKGDNATDDTQAIQDAIDSGKKTVYFPGGKMYKINGTINIRGQVRKLIGCSGKLKGKGTIRFEDGSEPIVVMDNFDCIYSKIKLIHNSSRTLVLRNVTTLPITSYGSGDFYIDDIAASPHHFENPKQRIWIRQFNPEGIGETNTTNNGATLWILGLKTEQDGIKIKTKNGGKTEVLGAHIYAQGQKKTTPLFVAENSSVSFSGIRQISNGKFYETVIREIRGDSTRAMKRAEIGNTFCLYTGYTDSSNTAYVNNGFQSFPTGFKLLQNYPNPFNAETKIEFHLPAECDLNLNIYNILGDIVASHALGIKPAGIHSFQWRAYDEEDKALSTGIYFYRLQATHKNKIFSKSQKMMLVN